MRVLVTGGAGFIGSHLVGACLAAGDEVRVLDDFSTGRRSRLDPVADRVEIVEGTVTDAEAVARSVRGCEVVHHLAAIPSVTRSIEDPAATHEVNATGTVRVLEAARDADVRRVIYAGSCAVYGDPAELPVRESAVLDPRSPYAVQKQVGELYGVCFAGLWDLDVVTLRYFNVYGPGQDADSPYSAVIPRFLTAACKGSPARVFGDGLQSRDFVWVGDVVRANLAAAAAPGRMGGGALNVGSGHRTSVLDLVDAISGLVDGGALEREHAPARSGEIRHSVADVSAIGERLGWSPQTPLADGLARTLRALRGGAAS